MEVELRTDGKHWNTTRIMIDGMELKCVRRAKISVNGVHMATIEAGKDVVGNVRYVPYATVEIARYENLDGRISRGDDGPVIIHETFEKVNIVPLES
jgi:hypothetical protein